MGLAELRREIARQTEANPDAPAQVSVPLFFDGNADEASIGCNLVPHPGMPKFGEVFRALCREPGVRDVTVEISEDMGPDAWAFADWIFLAGPVSLEHVQSIVAPLDVSDVYELPTDEHARASTLLPLRDGEHLLAIWWD